MKPQKVKLTHDGLEWVYKIKLPALGNFRSSTRSGKSPFLKFHLWVADQFGGLPKNKRVRVGASWLAPADEKILADLVKVWIKKQLTYGGKERIEREFSWHNLDIGPSSFSLDKNAPSWLEPGYAYVAADLFEDNKDFQEAA